MNQSEDNTNYKHPQVVADQFSTGNPIAGKDKSPESNEQQGGLRANLCKKISALPKKAKITIIVLFIIAIVLAAVLPAVIISKQKQQNRYQIIQPNQKFATAVMTLKNGEYIHTLNAIDNGDGTYNVIQIVQDSLSSYSPQSEVSVKKVKGQNLNQPIYEVSFHPVQLLEFSYSTFQMPRSEDEFLKLYNLNSEEFTRKLSKIGSQKQINIVEDDENKIDQLLGRRFRGHINIDAQVHLRGQYQDSQNLQQQNEVKQETLAESQDFQNNNDVPNSLNRDKPGTRPRPRPIPITPRYLRLPWVQDALQSNEGEDLNEQFQLNEETQDQLSLENEEAVEGQKQKKEKNNKNRGSGKRRGDKNNNGRRRKPKKQTGSTDQISNDVPIKSWEVLSSQLKLFVEIQYNYEKSIFEVVRFQKQQQKKQEKKEQKQSLKQQSDQFQLSDSQSPQSVFEPQSLSAEETQTILSDIVQAAELLLENTIKTSIENMRYNQEQLQEEQQKYLGSQGQEAASASNEALKNCSPITQGVFRCTPEDAQKIVEGFKAEQVNDPQSNLYVNQLQILRIKEVSED